MPHIDLNCDLGEGFSNDEALMSLITSANIACGAHAGDVTTMREAVRLAQLHGVVIGAHPGFADRGHCGRREMAFSRDEIVDLVRTQVRALQEIASTAGAVVRHVKPHGALYNLAARDAGVAAAIAKAVSGLDANLVLYGLSGGELLKAGRAHGLKVAAEVFADRTYQCDGALTPRDRPGAVIVNRDEVLAQVLMMVREGRVRATDGSLVPIVAETLCLHGDDVMAVDFARDLRTALSVAGVDLRAIV